MKLFLLIAAASMATTAALAADPPKYTGPGSCASPSCHGGVAPRTDNSVWQNEYSTWVVKDKHAQAHTVLSNPVATRMGKILAIADVTTAPKCLACHALDVPPEQRARTFDAADGVSCESCHGPASNWLGPHTTKGWTHQQSVDAGMYDDRDLIHRAEKCLGCHLGTKDKFVDHEMIAAGHPDLYFDLASFSAVMPKHWKERAPNDDPWSDVRTLAVGQAVQLREQLRRIARYANSPKWPEYSTLDCFACHHSLTAPKDSWRQERGYENRRPGNPPVNFSGGTILALFAANDPDYGRLMTELSRVYRDVAATSNGAEGLSEAAIAADAADRIAQRLATARFDQAMTLDLLKRLSSFEFIAGQDERAAEQVTMALNSLFLAYSKATQVDNADAIRNAIRDLFKQLEDPSSYNAPKFAAQMRALNGLLK